jgi:hypothetical protein
MKLHTFLLGSAASLALLAPISAETEVRITGSTAFRSAANNAIIDALGGSGVTEYAYVGASLSGASKAIFTGSVGGETYTIYTNFSGSTSGISQIADQTTTTGWVQRAGNARSPAGTSLSSGTYVQQTATADLAFSDVDKALSNNPNANLGGGPVGVVPFQFVAQKGADSLVAGIDNVTDQIVENIYSLGFAPASLFSGDPAHAGVTVLASGRDNGSGTRATVLAETQYGVFRNVAQYQVAANGALSEFAANAGYSGSGDMRTALLVDSATNTSSGSPINAFLLGYVGAADTVTISGYNQATGAFTPGTPVPLKYNGVRYSRANVINGTYTLWGYQQLFTKNGITSLQTAFDTALRAAIPTQLTGASVLSIAELNVERNGGDGGPVAPKLN